MRVNKIIVLIPALNPDTKLINTVEELMKKNINDIIVINDGSNEKSIDIFKQIENKGIKVLVHDINKGKGRALKTAFEYILEKSPDCVGVVTADADGQHATGDIINIINELDKEKDKLILGARAFDKNVPLKSKIGNVATRTLFKIAYGISLRDTQTGLRGIPMSYIKKLIDIEGERFEFEMNMLIETKVNNIEIKEITIETIYIDNNKQSKFKPIKDSMKVLNTFLKYILSSGMSFIIDIAIFSIMIKLLKTNMPNEYIILSTIIARMISSVFNFTINRNIVFKGKHNITKQIFSYYTLCIIQMGLSAILVNSIYHSSSVSETIIKILVDTVLFFISFKIQKIYIFKEGKK